MAPQSPPCTANRGIAQGAVHQLGHAVGDFLDAKARLPGFEGQAIAGKRRRHDGERVRGIAAETRRVRQARDQLEELEDRARPAVQQQQRARGRSLAGDMQEMEVDAAERHLKLRERR